MSGSITLALVSSRSAAMVGTVNGSLQTGHHTELNETSLIRGRLLALSGFFLGSAKGVNGGGVQRVVCDNEIPDALAMLNRSRGDSSTDCGFLQAEVSRPYRSR